MMYTMWRRVLLPHRRLSLSTPSKARQNIDSDWDYLKNLLTITTYKKWSDQTEKTYVCKRAFEIFENVLSNSQAGLVHFRLIAQIMNHMGRYACYDESAYDNFSKFLQTTDSEMAMLKIMPPFLGLSASVGYYNPTLLQACVSYAKENLNHLNVSEYLLLMKHLGRMRFRCPSIADGVEHFLLSEKRYQKLHSLSWIRAWYGMINHHYPEELLTRILTDDYIEDSRKKYQLFNPSILFQLKIALNLDFQIGLETEYESDEVKRKWGSCQSGMKNVNHSTMVGLYDCMISNAVKTKRDGFSDNIWQALVVSLKNSECILRNCLSLSGYKYDFEIMFDNKGNPLNCPRKWKDVSEKMLKDSISSYKEQCKIMKGTRKIGSPSEHMKLSDSVEWQRKHSIPLEEEQNLIFQRKFNLASDWGSKFACPPANVCHKVVIDCDGYLHYAQNANHQLGHAFLKERQTKLLGWKYISMNYNHWNKLSSEDQSCRIEELLKQTLSQ